MKLRELIELLQQLDQDADVRTVSQFSMSAPPEDEDYVIPVAYVKDIKGRKTVCLE